MTEKNIDMLTVLPEIPKDNFRFQNQKCMLTYKTHIDKEKYLEFICKKIKRTPKFLRIAHEKGINDPLTPYEHSHVLIDFGKRFQSKSSRCFDFNDIHPNIKKITTINCWDNCKNYIAKEDPECFDLKAQSSEIVLNNLGACENEREALLSCLGKDGKINWSHVSGIRMAYEIMKPKIQTHYEEPTFQWQLDLIEELKSPRNNRKIIWFFDKIGCSGKTQLARYLQLTTDNEYLCTRDMGTSRDAATIIKNAIDGGWKQKCIIVDLPRSVENAKQRIYQYLEDIKDGSCTVTKYQGCGSLLFDQPHMVIFSNWKPVFNAVSVDRWDIREIKKDKSVQKVPRSSLLRGPNPIERAADILSLLSEEEIEEAIKLSKF